MDKLLVIKRHTSRTHLSSFAHKISSTHCHLLCRIYLTVHSCAHWMHLFVYLHPKLHFWLRFRWHRSKIILFYPSAENALDSEFNVSIYPKYLFYFQIEKFFIRCRIVSTKEMRACVQLESNGIVKFNSLRNVGSFSMQKPYATSNHFSWQESHIYILILHEIRWSISTI